MRFPRQWIVGDGLWTLKFVRVIEEEKEGYHTVRGLCDPSDKTVYIKTNLRPRERLTTVLHELLHCIEHEYEINLGHKVIYALEEKLADLLRENLPGFR